MSGGGIDFGPYINPVQPQVQPGQPQLQQPGQTPQGGGGFPQKPIPGVYPGMGYPAPQQISSMPAQGGVQLPNYGEAFGGQDPTYGAAIHSAMNPQQVQAAIAEAKARQGIPQQPLQAVQSALQYQPQGPQLPFNPRPFPGQGNDMKDLMPFGTRDSFGNLPNFYGRPQGPQLPFNPRPYPGMPMNPARPPQGPQQRGLGGLQSFMNRFRNRLG